MVAHADAAAVSADPAGGGERGHLHAGGRGRTQV